MSPEEKTRVDFNAPSSLVEQADAIADLLDASRTQLLIEALRDEIAELTSDEDFRRQVKQAYYAGRIDLDVLESVLGAEAAARVRLLRDSVARDPPEPRVDAESEPASAFYDGELPSWEPDDSGVKVDDNDAGADEPAPTSGR